jgi:predicted nuclease of restriction endonuclease-like (RecB) superfamily
MSEQNNIQLYKDDFEKVVTLIQSARANVYQFANSALIDLYWNIGKYISSKVASSEWGDSVVNNLAEYIAQKNPDLKGFSNKNLWRMKKFYEAYSLQEQKVSALLRQIGCTNNLTIMSRCKSDDERRFYFELCAHDHLSSRQLDRQIDSSLYERTRLSKPKVSAVLRQIQLNFYLEALDRDVKKPKKNPSIGVLLCKDKDDEVVEYALSRTLSPTMVAEYRLNMPDKKLLRDKLKEIEDTADNYK